MRSRTITYKGAQNMPTEQENQETETRLAETRSEVPQAVDTEKVAADAAARVRENNAVLLKLGDDYENLGEEGAKDLALRAVTEGKDEAWLRGEIGKMRDERLEKIKKDGERNVQAMRFLSDKENKEFMLVRLFRHMAHPENKAFKEAAGLEIEAGLEAQRLNQSVAGISATGQYGIPMDFPFQPVARSRAEQQWLESRLRERALTVGVGGTSANEADELVATVLDSGRFIDLLRNNSALLGNVMEIPGLTSNVDIPRQTGTATTSWVEESPGSDYSLSDQSFDTISLSPKKLFVGTAISNTALIQATPGIEMLVRMDLARSRALKIDDALLNGSAADDKVPTGILNVTGITKVDAGTDTNGIAASLNRVASLFQEVDARNALYPNSRFLTHSRLKWRLSVLEVAANTGIFLWRDNRVLGYMADSSNQVPNATRGSGGNASPMLVYSPDDVLFASFGTEDVQYNPYSQRRKGLVEITVFSHHDAAVRHAETIAWLNHVITAIA